MPGPGGSVGRASASSGAAPSESAASGVAAWGSAAWGVAAWGSAAWGSAALGSAALAAAAGSPPNAATFSRPSPGHGPVPGPGPTTATTSGRSRSSVATASAQAARSSGSTGSAPVSSRTSSGGPGQSAALVITISSGQPADGPGGRLLTLDRGHHGQHFPGLTDLMHSEDAGTQPGADGRGGQRPGQPLVRGNVQRLPDEVLVGQGHQHRPAGGHHLAQPPGDLQRLPGVLAEVVGRVDQDPGRVHSGRGGAGCLGQGAVQDVGHHIVVGDPERPGPRGLVAGA